MSCPKNCKCRLCVDFGGGDYRMEMNSRKSQRDKNISIMKKARSTFELNPRLDPNLKSGRFPSAMNLNNMNNLSKSNSNNNVNNITKRPQAELPENKHKVVIYFSDAYNNIMNKPHNGGDSDHAKRLVEEMQRKQLSQSNSSVDNVPDNAPSEFMQQLKTVLEEKSKQINKKYDRPAPAPPQLATQQTFIIPKELIVKPPRKSKELKDNNINIEKPIEGKNEKIYEKIDQTTYRKPPLPSFIESIENNVINLKIEQNFKKASHLVNIISSMSSKKKKKEMNSNETSSVHELNFTHEDDEDTASEPDEGYYYDWSFVQEWRTR